MVIQWDEPERENGPIEVRDKGENFARNHFQTVNNHPSNVTLGTKMVSFERYLPNIASLFQKKCIKNVETRFRCELIYSFASNLGI